MAVYTPPEELNHTLPPETDERGVATTEEAPYGDLFSGLQDDEQAPEEKAPEEKPPQEEDEKFEQVAEEKDDEEKVAEKSLADLAAELQSDQEELGVLKEESKPPVGVSLAMRELAISSGLPPFFVDNLYDDAQVQVYMDARRAANTAEQDTLTAKLMIPDEDFDPQDPAVILELQTK